MPKSSHAHGGAAGVSGATASLSRAGSGAVGWWVPSQAPHPSQCLTHGGFGVLPALCSMGAGREQFETVELSSQAAASSVSILPEGFHPVVLGIFNRVKATFI